MADEARSVAAALEEVARWQAEEESRVKAELDEVDQEVQRLQAAVANLQQQLEALGRFREELTQKNEGIGDGVIDQSYSAIFAALESQIGGARIRSKAVSEAEAARAAGLTEAMTDSAVASLLQEYQQFKTTVEPTLSALPESYRGVIRQHHDGVVEKLRDHLGRIVAGPVAVDGDELAVDIVYSVDAPEGAPELLIMVLPVEESVHTEWASRDEDLQTLITARAVQGVYVACKAAGLPGAQAMFGGHQGLLAVEVELVGASNAVGDLIGQTINSIMGMAAELKAAKVKATATAVSIDFLLPPETGDELDDEEAANA